MPASSLQGLSLKPGSFGDRVSPCSSCWLGTCYVGQVKICLSASQELGLAVPTIIPGIARPLDSRPAPGTLPSLGFPFSSRELPFPHHLPRHLKTRFPRLTSSVTSGNFLFIAQKQELRSKERWKESGRGDTGKGWDLAHPFLRPSHP